MLPGVQLDVKAEVKIDEIGKLTNWRTRQVNV